MSTFGKKSSLRVVKKSSIEDDPDDDKMTEDTCRAFLMALTSFSGTLGFLIFITGCIVTTNYNLFIDFITGRYSESSIFMILIGLIIIVVSAIG